MMALISSSPRPEPQTEVLMDLVHAHASSNTLDGIAQKLGV